MSRKKTPEKQASAIDYGTLPELIGYQLRLAQIRVFKDFVQATEVSPGLLGVLMLIEANPGLTQSALAAAVHLDRSTMVGVIDRLEAQQWVARQSTSTDRRAYRLLLTASGTAKLQEFKQVIDAHEKRILESLSPDEITALRLLLPKIARPTTEDGEPARQMSDGGGEEGRQEGREERQ
jgi:DNA-binding MarR family transcriptional regulator